jgi:hypothetical protein
MLNLPIAMLRFPLIFSFVFLVQTANISITSPISGDILRGQVEIVGNMNIPDFSSAELAFSYASNPADSWFTIQTFPQPIVNSTIATWDTTSLTDADYILHLRVFLQDGSSQDVVVSDLKIRNDLMLPTQTPIGAFSPQLLATAIPSSTEKPALPAISFPSSTPLPFNPASVRNSSIYSNFTGGALLALGLFIILGIFLRLRSRA